MTNQSYRPLSLVFALVLTAAFWVPTLSNPAFAAPTAASESVVFASASPLVLM